MTQGVHDSGPSPRVSAWGDESMRFAGAPQAYVMAAAIIDDVVQDDVREVMRPLRVAGPKLHWRDLDQRQRDKVVKVIAGLEVMHMVAIAIPMDPRRQERARAKCMERLLAHLAQFGVEQLTMEQRSPLLNTRDQRLITRLRGKRAFPSTLSVNFGRPSAEPLLWVPDAVAGAIGDELDDASTPWAKQLTHCVERLDIDLLAE